MNCVAALMPAIKVILLIFSTAASVLLFKMFNAIQYFDTSIPK